MHRGVCGRCITWHMQMMQRLHAARTAGFHHGSIRKTCDAAVRLSATPPALRLIRNTRTLQATARQHIATAPWRVLSPSLANMRRSLIMRDMLLTVTDQQHEQPTGWAERIG